MLVGNFCAIASSVVFAMYALSSASIIKSDSLPFSIYLALMSIYMVIISFVASWFFSKPVDLFSVDPVNGAFGMFATT